MDIQEKQREVLVRMLRPDGEDGSLTWKVLVFDDRCMKVLAALFHVQQLQKHGVTVMMKLNDKRERIEDTPAFYLVEPSKKNISRIAKDCKLNLYDSIHLNFSSRLSRPLLQQLAKETIQTGAHTRISRVLDQYCDFICMSKRLVSLGMARSFVKLTRPSSEQALMSYVDRIVDGLFSIIVTLKQIPIIRCSPGNAAALAARRLHSKLREHLMSRNNLFSGGVSSYKRPLLILLDRNMDLSVPLHHPWTYQALVHDIYGIQSNKVIVPVEKTTKSYNLSSDVAEGVQKYLNEYNEKATQLKREGVELSDLKNAVNSMPELMKKKQMIDAHTNIATALLKQLKDRMWDRYFELEEELINNMPPTKQDMLSQIKPDSKGTPSDKLRLYLIYSLTHTVDPEDAKEMESILQGYANASSESEYPALKLSCLKFLRTYKMEQKFTSKIKESKTSKNKSDNRSLFNIISDTVGARGKKLLQGVRNLVPTDKSLPTTKLVERLMENTESKSTKRFLYFDPKLLKVEGPISGSMRIKDQFYDGFVFVMGGGNFVEHQNLQDYAKRATTPQATVNIAYGSTEILSGQEFLTQLNILGDPPTGGDVDVDLD